MNKPYKFSMLKANYLGLGGSVGGEKVLRAVWVSITIIDCLLLKVLWILLIYSKNNVLCFAFPISGNGKIYKYNLFQVT